LVKIRLDIKFGSFFFFEITVLLQSIPKHYVFGLLIIALIVL